MKERGSGRVYQPTYRDKKSGDLKTSAIWWVAVTFRGKKHRESSHSPKRGDAVRLLNRRLGEMGQGRLIGPRVEKTTFTELVRMLVENYRTQGPDPWTGWNVRWPTCRR